MTVILIAEDDAHLRRAYRYLLQDLGYEPIAAENGRQALEAVLAHRPALVLTDIAMPVMDGIELARALREREDTATLPLVAVTGVEDAKYAGLSSQLFDRILRKPLIIEELMAVVSTMLKARTPRPSA